MKIKDGFILRNIADEYIVVPVGEKNFNLNGIINLNEVAAFLWENMQSAITKEGLVKKLLENYDVSEKNAELDVEEFIKKVKDAGFLDL